MFPLHDIIKQQLAWIMYCVITLGLLGNILKLAIVHLYQLSFRCTNTCITPLPSTCTCRKTCTYTVHVHMHEVLFCKKSYPLSTALSVYIIMIILQFKTWYLDCIMMYYNNHCYSLISLLLSFVGISKRYWDSWTFHIVVLYYINPLMSCDHSSSHVITVVVQTVITTCCTLLY